MSSFGVWRPQIRGSLTLTSKLGTDIIVFLVQSPLTAQKIIHKTRCLSLQIKKWRRGQVQALVIPLAIVPLSPFPSLLFFRVHFPFHISSICSGSVMSFFPRKCLEVVGKSRRILGKPPFRRNFSKYTVPVRYVLPTGVGVCSQSLRGAPLPSLRKTKTRAETLSLPSSKSTFSQLFQRDMYK